MTKTLSLLLAMLLLATPAFAYPQLPVGAEERDGDGMTSLEQAVATVSKELAAESAEESTFESPARTDGGAALAVQEAEQPRWKLAVGLGLLGGGAATLARGFDLKVDEPDRFGRRTDKDAYFAMGVGGTFMAFGAMMVASYLK